jgi:signal peptidase I
VAVRPRHDERDDDPADGGSPDPSVRRFWRELPILLVAAIAIAIILKTFLVQAFFIPSVSMAPTLQRGDRILVCRICVRLGGVDRGDVIVFEDPAPPPAEDRGPIEAAVRWLAEGVGFAQPEDKDFVKRVVGLPGDVVELHDGELFVNGERVEERYLHPRIDTTPYGPVTVPDGMLFVLGDNRAQSGDSRFPPPTGVGLVPEDAVIGTAFVVVYPPARWGSV